MSTIRDCYGLYGHWDVGTIGTTWITKGTMCMPPGLQITLGRPLQFLPGCPAGLLTGASCPSRINQ